MSLTGDVLGQIGAEVSLNGGVGGSIEFTGEGTDNYDELDNRPSINGVVLTGNKTTEDLHIDTGGTDDYLDLNNKPKINSVTLRGDVSSASLQISYNDLTDRPVIPDLTDLENRMDAVEGDIQSIETDIGDIGDRLIDIASDIATIQATDLVQNSDISSLKNRMNAAETSITNLGSRLTTAEGTISTHTTDISDLDNRLDTAEDNISDAQNDISDLQGDVTSLDTIVGDGQQTVGTDLTDAVTQINSSLAINDITSQLTPNGGILTFNGHVRTVGKVMYIYIQITPNRAISAFSALVGDFPVPLDGFDIVASASNTERIGFYITQAGLLSNRQALTANTVYLLCGSCLIN